MSASHARFMWPMAKDQIMHNMNRKARQFSDCGLCPKCGAADETTLHVMRDCAAMVDVWLRLVHHSWWVEFFSSSLEEWCELNLKRDLSKGKDGNWRLCFGLTCWVLWKRRNNWIFDQESHQRDVVMELFSCVHEFSKGMALLHRMGSANAAQMEYSGVWKKPADGWFKLNSDAACWHGGRVITYGGVIKNYEGKRRRKMQPQEEDDHTWNGETKEEEDVVAAYRRKKLTWRRKKTLLQTA